VNVSECQGALLEMTYIGNISEISFLNSSDVSVKQRLVTGSKVSEEYVDTA
jgi:hypothetical protein